jgi:hypothetical protein
MITFIEKENSIPSNKNENKKSTNEFNATNENNLGIQSTFVFSTRNSSMLNSYNNNNLNNYEIDSLENKNFTPSCYSNEIDPDVYPQNSSNFNYEMINFDRDIRVEDQMYPTSFIWNFEDYFTI